eukprot:GAHX01002562.1.p1 GENE.GAHX01002562.1~~GAHX01002562.1.p1  ORF type:complete len:459 (+),score=64.19 GAHX01002562.1:64-1440(+)
MPNVLTSKNKTYICAFIFGIGTFIQYHFVVGHAQDFLPKYAPISVILLNVFILIAKMSLLVILGNFTYNQKIFSSFIISAILYIGLFLFFNFYPINNSPDIDATRIIFFVLLLCFICLQQALNEIVFCGINTFYNSTTARFYSSGTGASGMLAMFWLFISRKFSIVYYYEFIYYIVLSTLPYFLYYLVLDRKYIYRREKHLNELHNDNTQNKENDLANIDEERSETVYSQSYTKSKTASYTTINNTNKTNSGNSNTTVKYKYKYNENISRKENKRLSKKELLREKYKNIKLDTVKAKLKVVVFELMEYNIIWSTCYIFVGLFTGGIANFYDERSKESAANRAMQLVLIRTAAFVGRTLPLFIVIEYLRIWPVLGLLTTMFAFIVIEIKKMTFSLFICFSLIGLTYGAGLGYSILSIKKNKPFKIAKIGLEFSNFNSQLGNAIGSTIGLLLINRYRNRF